MKKVVLLGAPGVGKGTQASQVAKHLDVNSMASGDLFRDHLSRETELGLQAKSYMSVGELVPDEITIGMVTQWLSEGEQVKGFVLDGFPRTITQAEALDDVLNNGNGGLDRVIHIVVPVSELIERLSGRYICTKCQKPYHLVSSPPLIENQCDDCNVPIYQRDDDRSDAVKKRLEVYEEQTAPLVEYYLGSGIIAEVDGVGGIDEVRASIQEVLA
jgi:adenylate kinase